MSPIDRTEHNIVVLKLANQNQIIWQCHDFENILINNYQHHALQYHAKVL